MSESGPRRGRPRVWASAEERKQAHRESRRQRTQLLEALFQAMSDAWWEEPELRRTVALGTDHEALQALIAHFRGRHWMHYPATKQPRPSQPRTD